MKLIGLFGALLAISPVFAATPGSCAGKVPTTTVAECDKSKPCSFFYSKSNPRGFEIEAYEPCGYADQGVRCRGFETMEECLSHQCFYGAIKPDGKPKLVKCQERAHFFFKLESQPPRAIKEF